MTQDEMKLHKEVPDGYMRSHYQDPHGYNELALRNKIINAFVYLTEYLTDLEVTWRVSLAGNAHIVVRGFKEAYSVTWKPSSKKWTVFVGYGTIGFKTKIICESIEVAGHQILAKERR